VARHRGYDNQPGRPALGRWRSSTTSRVDIPESDLRPPADFDIIPKTLTLDAWYPLLRYQHFEVGSNVAGFGCEIYGPYDGAVPTFLHHPGTTVTT